METRRRRHELRARKLAVGKLYVGRYFPPEEKARAQAMVKNLLAAFATRIDHLEWMAPATRVEAKAKLAALKVGVGYPDHWIDYSGLEVVRGDALGNAERAQLFEYHRNLKKFGTPVDRSEWAMTPQLVERGELAGRCERPRTSPPAILQLAVFDPQRDVVLDYGAIGSVIGHEISHSFDDQGRCSMPPDACATGGPGRTSRTSRPPATTSPRSSTATVHSRTWR